MQIRKRSSEAERLQAIRQILEWTNPGPGGFYDDLGNSSAQPHLVRGLDYEKDPAFLASPHAGFEEGVETDDKPEGAWRYSWLNHAESLNDAPLTLHYDKLDRSARYKLRVVYGGDSRKKKIRLSTGDGVEIHPLMAKPWPVRPIEFEIPPSATARGELTLNWFREPALGGNGRGCQVSEVWVIKQ